MKRIAVTLIALATLAPAGLEAQITARERAQRTLPPQVFDNLSELVGELGADGVPDGPLYNKALEGVAKGVPPEMLLPAVRAYATRLGDARQALGPNAGVPLIVAAADAIQRGVSPDVIRSLPSDRPRSPVAMLVLADLLESGVPADRALAILRQVMQQRTRDATILDIPARVRRLIRDGVPPQEAVDRVRRAIQRERGGVGPMVPPGTQPLTRDRLRRLRRSGDLIG